MRAQRPPAIWYGAPLAFVLLAVGCVGPWVTSELPGVEAGGFEKDGQTVLVLGAVALGLLVVWRQSRAIGWSLGAAGCAGFGALIALFDLGDFDNETGSGDPGWGLYLTLIAASLLAAVAVLLTLSGRSRGTSGTRPRR